MRVASVAAAGCSPRVPAAGPSSARPAGSEEADPPVAPHAAFPLHGIFPATTLSMISTSSLQAGRRRSPPLPATVHPVTAERVSIGVRLDMCCLLAGLSVCTP